MKSVTDRFLTYVKKNTTSDSETGLSPSTPGQMLFAQDLVAELKLMGLEEVSISQHGYVMATLPANVEGKVPTIGFISHMDTSPDMSGKNVKPQIVYNYPGGDVKLNDVYTLNVADFTEVEQYIGQDIVFTDGTTLLGADDKAGIAEILTAIDYLIAHPEVKHGKIRIGFTPDEEIGAGADHFDVAEFGADWAYTLDGGEIGELEYENFNAAGANITFTGRNVHPGYAKGKMRNSMRIASQFISLLSRFQTPEHTEDYEGFFHLTSMNGEVEKTTLQYIIRDHDRMRFDERKKEIAHLVNKINAEFGKDTAVLEMKDQYYNMKEKIEPVMFIIDIAEQAMKDVNITPKIKPIRGGTDGSRLSFMGLPCPNLFAGGHNFHGRYEFVPIQSMEKAVELIVRICELSAMR